MEVPFERSDSFISSRTASNLQLLCCSNCEGLNRMHGSANGRDSLSLILPVLNESREIRRFLSSLRRETPDELIVVDGGSTDDTLDIARRASADLPRRAGPVRVDWCRATDGLAAQLNRGADSARGDILFFPYADSRLPDGWLASIHSVLADPGTVAGAFRLGFDVDSWLFRGIARIANLRTALGIGPLGDQGIFVRREIFEACGGFREDRLLEDLDLAHRVRAYGRLEIVGRTLRSSTRRWRQRGILRTSFENWLYLARHLVGRGARHRSSYRQYRIGSH